MDDYVQNKKKNYKHLYGLFKHNCTVEEKETASNWQIKDFSSPSRICQTPDLTQPL